MLPRRASISLLLAPALAIASGCTVASRHADRGDDSASRLAAQRRTAAVFQSPDVNAALAGIDTTALPEYSRHDDALAIASPRSPVAADVWPQPEQATLERQRYYNVQTSSTSYLFFSPQRYARWWYPGTQYPLAR